MADSFQKLTEEAHQAVALAHEEARRLNQPYVGTEHLLLGLLGDSDGVAARSLRHLGIEPVSVRAAVEFIFGQGQGAVEGKTEMSPLAARVLKRAAHEARRLNHPHVDSGHLILALVREGGRGAAVLTILGVNQERLRMRLVADLGGQAG